MQFDHFISNLLANDSSVIFVSSTSPNVSSDSVIFVGMTTAKIESEIEIEKASPMKTENNNNDDAELSEILDSFLAMNLNTTPVQRKCVAYLTFVSSNYFLLQTS